MKVVTVYDNPTWRMAGYDELIVLELVAHFLGIATHHNDNSAPSPIAALEFITGVEDA